MDIRKAFDAAAAGAAYNDFEWYAIDAEGHLAVFTSAGYGPIPRSIFSSRDAYVALASIVENRPLSSWCTLNTHSEGDLAYWVESARRGLFGYDWTAQAGSAGAKATYQWMATPEVGMTVEELPRPIAAYVEATWFRGVTFGRDLELRVEAHFADVVY